MFCIADHAAFAVSIRLPPAILTESRLRWHAARGGTVEFAHRRAVALGNIPARKGIAQRFGMNGRQMGVEQSCAVQLSQQRHNPAGAVNVFHVHVRLGRCDLGQHWHLARQCVDVGHGEIHFRLMRGGQQMEDGICRSAHRDVERHGILERAETGNGARQGAFIVFFVIPAAQIYYEPPCFKEQLFAVSMGRQH